MSNSLAVFKCVCREITIYFYRIRNMDKLRKIKNEYICKANAKYTVN